MMPAARARLHTLCSIASYLRIGDSYRLHATTLLAALVVTIGALAAPAPSPAPADADAIAAFSSWMDRYASAPAELRPTFTAEGLYWAELRRGQMANLIRTDPAQALAVAVPALERELLPVAILDKLEQPVSGFGDLLVRAVEPADPHAPAPLQHSVRIGERRYTALLHGRRAGQGPKQGIPLSGITLDGDMAVRASVLHFRDGSQAPLGDEPFVDLAVPLPESGDSFVWAEMGGLLYRFSDTGAREAAELRLEAAESGPDPEPAQHATVAIEPFASIRVASESIGRRLDSWTQGTKRILVLLVDFSDLPGAPADATTVQELFDRSVAPFYARASYGRVALVAQVNPRIYRLPRAATEYATGGLWDVLRADACTAAAVDSDAALFDRVVVGFKRIAEPTIPGSKLNFAGISDVHGPYVGVNGTGYFNAFLLIHELGHTMGLLHANLWQVNDGNPTSPAGYAVNQGDDFDPMGRSGYLTERQDFNPFFKYRLGWIDECHVRTVEASGTYRISAFDHLGAAAETGPLAVRIPCGDQSAYWVSCRRNYPAGEPIENGAYVVRAEELYNPGTVLIDTATPGSNTTDASLLVNRSLSDSGAGITIKPVAEGGTAPGSTMDIAITLAPTAPSILSQPASRSVDAGSTVEFTVAATGTPPPTYQWEKAGVSIAGATGATLRLLNVSSADAGDYTVVVGNSVGSVRSQTATLTIAPQQPVIVYNPPNRLSPVGGTATFSVTVGSALPVTYQWYFDGHALAGATGESLTLTNVQAINAGYYGVLAANSAGAVWSGLGRLSVGTSSPDPVVVEEPADLTLPEGGSGSFTIAAVGDEALRYVWLKEGRSLGSTDGPYLFQAVTAADAGRYVCVVADSDSNTVSREATLTVIVAPKIVRQSGAQTAAQGSGVHLSFTPEDASSAATYRWLKNGAPIASATSPTIDLPSLSPAATGLYEGEIADGAQRVRSEPIVVGLRPNGRTAGAVTTRPEWQNIRHPNGNIYDQFLLNGTAGTITADTGQIARISMLDPQGDIVQVEMSGSGALTVVLENPTGPKTPSLYNQPGVEYMQGHPRIVLVGADANTHVSVFSVGRLTNPGVTRTDADYDGWADIASLGLDSTDRGFGGLYLGNARFSGEVGLVGIYAPTIATIGRVSVHEIAAVGAARPSLVFAPDGTAAVRIAGSSLLQTNGAGIVVSGMVEVLMAAGQGSSGQNAPARAIAARLLEQGVDITDLLVTGP